MKYNVKKAISAMQSKLLGHVAVMSYGYCQLCVKADPSSLLSIEIPDGGLLKHIEDVADVYLHDEKDDDDKMDIVPKYSDFFFPIISQIHEAHPEFKITIEDGENEGMPEEIDVKQDNDSLDAKYIRLTMPEVNKDRRDILNTAINALNETCKARMTAAQVKCASDIAELLLTDTIEAKDEAKKLMDETYEQYKDMCNNLTDDKKKEVEDAYQRYLTGQAEKEKADMSDPAVVNTGQSLRME